MDNRFHVEVIGVFYTFELLNKKGDYCYDLMEAAEAAEQNYKDGWIGEWSSVFNGETSLTREDYLKNETLNKNR